MVRKAPHDTLRFVSVVQFEEAQEMLLEALGICPSLPLAYYKLALCILAQGGPAALSAAKHPLRCAARLEVGNRVMRGSIDMVLRVITYVA